MCMGLGQGIFTELEQSWVLNLNSTEFYRIQMLRKKKTVIAIF